MIPTLEEVLSLCPPVKGKKELVSQYQTSEEILKLISECLTESGGCCKKFAPIFAEGNSTVKEICSDIWEFEKEYFRFVAESQHDQTGRTIPAILQMADDGQILDCKHFSTFALGVLQALGIKSNLRVCWYGRNKYPTHVYCIAYEEDGEPIVVDATLNSFNRESSSVKYQDLNYKKMALYKISASEEEMGKRVRRYKNHPVPMSFPFRFKLPDGKEISKNIFAFNKEQAEREAVSVRRRLHPEGTKITMFPRKPMTQAEIGKWKISLHSIEKGIENDVHKVVKGIENAAKSVEHDVALVAAAPARLAFLGLVASNIFGLADHLAKANQSQLKTLWQGLGGDYKKLVPTIRKGVEHGLEKTADLHDPNFQALMKQNGITGAGYISGGQWKGINKNWGDVKGYYSDDHGHNVHKKAHKRRINGESIGGPEVAIAAAVPIVTAIVSFLKSAGIITGADVDNANKFIKDGQGVLAISSAIANVPLPVGANGQTPVAGMVHHEGFSLSTIPTGYLVAGAVGLGLLLFGMSDSK